MFEDNLTQKGLLMEGNEVENFDENCIGMREQYDNPLIFYKEEDLKETIKKIKNKIKHQSLNGDGSLIYGLCSQDIDKVIKILDDELGDRLK